MAIARYPQLPDIWLNKGVSLYELKKYNDALKCFERVLELSPENSDGKTWKEKTLKLI